MAKTRIVAHPPMGVRVRIEVAIEATGPLPEFIRGISVTGYFASM
jgi:hypothetical protein